MKFIRVGTRILNSSAIVEAIDRGMVEVKSVEHRIVELRLNDGTPLYFEDDQAAAVWEKVTSNLEVWAETHSSIHLNLGNR
jgi:hypothetical protein